MKGVYFDDLHSFFDFRLILSSKTIETPNPKTIKIAVDGADGEIDLTDYFGETKYENRTLEFNFSSVVPIREFLEQFSEINNAIHGKRMKIIMDDDPDFYYIGRCSVSAWKWNGRVVELTITCDCEPYKYKLIPTKRTDTVSGIKTVNYFNLRKRVIPKITADSEINFSFNTNNFSIAAAGTYTFPDLIFEPGANRITFEGSANVTVEYQEGGI
jgi:phage-related protein